MVAMDGFYSRLLPQVPKKWMSHYFGKWAHKQAPGPVNQWLIQSFAKAYGINVEEAEKPLSEYQSLGEFFSRRLKEGARPIQGTKIHPCDGRVIQSGIIHNDTLIQAKGKTYTVREFLPSNPWSGEFEEGLFSTYYLAPNNYHRVHIPLTAKIRWVSVIPGELWPVNRWSVKHIDKLYAINERVAIGLETKVGKAVLVMVGATNVGSVTLSFDRQISTNQRKHSDPTFRTYTQPHNLKVGDELATFNMGSTVVLLHEKNFKMKPLKKGHVLMGESVGGTVRKKKVKKT